jgi:Ti-type conjugative transfer relaxase TraA
MLSIHKISVANASGLSRYYEQLGREDYYQNGGEPPGFWIGRGSERLHLSGNILEGELLRAMQGYHPVTGETLVRNAGADHAPGWDATFSAPKSVSAVWAVADRHTQAAIQSAQVEAVKAAIGYIEREATFVRYGAGGTEREPVSIHGGLIVAAYEHSTSRNADPQLHTHCIVTNITPDGRSIDLDTRHKMATGALYRVELASQLRELGYSIERDGDSFRIAGVPERLTEFWSSRHTEVQQALEEKGFSSYVASKVAVLNTREAKTDINRPELFTRWQEQAQEYSFGREQVMQLKRDEPVPGFDRPDPEQILKAVTEKHSTVSRVQLLHRVAIESQGAMNALGAQMYLQTVTAHPEAVRLFAVDGSERWTTREMQQLEKQMVERAENMGRDTRHQVPESALVAAIQIRTLSDEQIRATAHITRESGAVACVQGHAGTGKSYLLDAARETWQTAEYSVRGAALSGKAAEGLEKASGIPSQTLHSLLRDLEQNQSILNSRTVLVVDEAGMIGSRQMAALIDHTQRANTKLVLVGDTRQLQTINAGAAFRAIQDRVGGVELIDVRRQQRQSDREMAKAFREGRAADALQNLSDRGLLHVEKTTDRAQQRAVENYLRDGAEGKSTVILAASRREVRELNEAARVELRKAGVLRGDDVAVLTNRGERAFAEGDRVVFLRNSHDLDVKNGTTAEVLKIDDRIMRVQLSDGSERLVNHAAHYNHLDHGYALTVHKSQGTTVDRAHVVAGEMTGREWTYVAATRAREETRVYTTKEALGREVGQSLEKTDLARDMGRSHAKDTTQDYHPALASDFTRNTDSRSTDTIRENSDSPAYPNISHDRSFGR